MDGGGGVAADTGTQSYLRCGGPVSTSGARQPVASTLFGGAGAARGCGAPMGSRGKGVGYHLMGVGEAGQGIWLALMFVRLWCCAGGESNGDWIGCATAQAHPVVCRSLEAVSDKLRVHKRTVSVSCLDCFQHWVEGLAVEIHQ